MISPILAEQATCTVVKIPLQCDNNLVSQDLITATHYYATCQGRSQDFFKGVPTAICD